MLARRLDLPLSNDATSRYLPWLVALMAFLSAVALAAAFVIHGLVERWDRDVAGTLTVQVAPPIDDPDGSLARRRLDMAVELLRDTPGILSARALDREQLTALIEPWLGSSDLVDDLPLPQLIDVSLDPERHLDLGALAARLKAQVPGASLDDHRVWLSRLVQLSRTIQWVAVASVLLIGSVTSLTVVYSTRTGMAVHGDTIALLHLMGARDAYIARQFSERAFILGLRGGALGVLLALPVLAGIAWAAGRIEGGFLPDLSLPVAGWITIALLPALSASLAMATARATVHRALRRMF